MTRKVESEAMASEMSLSILDNLKMLGTFLVLTTFSQCRISMHWRCHDLSCLNEFSSVVLSCFTISLQTSCTDRSVTQLNRKTRSDHCSRQLFIEGRGSGMASVLFSKRAGQEGIEINLTMDF